MTYSPLDIEISYQMKYEWHFMHKESKKKLVEISKYSWTPL